MTIYGMKIGQSIEVKGLDVLGQHLEEAKVSLLDSYGSIREKVIYADVNNDIYGETILNKEISPDLITEHGVIYIMQVDGVYVINY